MNPYPLGATVRGANCIGQPFQAVVLEHVSSADCRLSDGYITPISLIVGTVEDDCPLGDEFGPAKHTQNIPENITAPTESASAQLSLF